MLWLYLLGAVTVLVIALRRVLHRQKPLDDELYSKKIAIDHIHSGVAWVRADGTIGSLNPSLAGSFGAKFGELEGRDWRTLFPQRERARIEEAYRQALLAGRMSFEISVDRLDGSSGYVDVLLLTVHDHKLRFRGHHLLTSDRTRERSLTEQVRVLGEALARTRVHRESSVADLAKV
jgi:PAS domain S-box-containing protein